MKFSYEVFDRLIDTLLMMGNMVTYAWEDYGTQEISLDIKSLVIKAARVCYMAEIDKTLQQENPTNSRGTRNLEIYAMLSEFVENHLYPTIKTVLKKSGGTFSIEGKKWPVFPTSVSRFLLQQYDFIEKVEGNKEKLERFTVMSILAERKMQKEFGTTKFPGMPTEERFWLFFEFHAMIRYLFYHFKSLICNKDENKICSDLGNLLQSCIHRFANSEEGMEELQRYRESLDYEKGDKLTIEELITARKKLLNEVPKCFQLSFMHYSDNLEKLAEKLMNTTPEENEYKDFVVAMAKWQMLTEEIELMSNPDMKPTLYNEVFYTILSNKHVDMLDLRERIKRMCMLVKRKNQWFCVWSVLYHHNLIKNKNFEAFARQMMHKDWFGGDKNIFVFSGDTLREYTGYFTERHYTVWDQEDFMVYRDVHKKRKWSQDLCEKFLRICIEMNDAFNGQIMKLP